MSLWSQEEWSVHWDFTSISKELKLDQCKFYVGDFIFYRNGQKIDEHSDYELIQMGQKESLSWNAKDNLGFDAFSFHLGVDSLIHEKSVMTGDLDPVNDMYWTWQSGYIHSKVEGSYQEKPIQLHLGGYQFPFRSDQQIWVRCNKIQHDYYFPSLFQTDFILKLKSIEKNGEWRVMSPQPDAVVWMQWFAEKMAHP
jgi:hypothetical protein